MTNYKWLLMDADNTLCDFTAAEDFALTRTLIRFGVPVSAQIKEGYRKINAALWVAHDKGELSQDALGPKRFHLFHTAYGIQGDP